MGALCWGLIAEQFGMRECLSPRWFFLFLVSVLTWWGIEEDYQQISKEEHLSSWELLTSIQHKDILLALFDQYDHSDDRSVHFSHSSTLCKRAWPERQCYFVSGLIVSAMGISSILTSGWMGSSEIKLATIASYFLALLYSGILYIFCCPAHTPFN